MESILHILLGYRSIPPKVKFLDVKECKGKGEELKLWTHLIQIASSKVALISVSNNWA